MSLQLPNTIRSALCRSCLNHRISAVRPGALWPGNTLPAKRPLSTSSPVSSPLRPRTSPLSAFTPRQHSSPRSLTPLPPVTSSVSGSGIFAQVFRRAFSSARPNLVRQTYFPKGSGYGGRREPPGGWFRNLRRRIDRLPAQSIVSGGPYLYPNLLREVRSRR